MEEISCLVNSKRKSTHLSKFIRIMMLQLKEFLPGSLLIEKYCASMPSFKKLCKNDVKSNTECASTYFLTYRVNIYFYLEDDTIHVSEPRSENSGIPQGTLIRRHRIPKDDSNGQHYLVSDLKVNSTITFYSRTFKIVGCDAFTREFLTSNGLTVGEPSAVPSDPWEECRKELLGRMKPTRPYKPKTSLKRFLENDRHVLRFYCIWDDTNSMFGDVRHMVIHYYLSDGTIEIREDIPANSGRESNTLFLRRCRLPKRPKHVSVHGGAGAGRAGKFNINTKAVQQVVEVVGKKILILQNFTVKVI